MLPEKIQSFIEKQTLFQGSDRLLLAISGGMDSVVLLHALIELGHQPALIHCNFQLRGEASDEDEAFIKELAKKYDLPFFCSRFETASIAKKEGVSIQMMARDQRYVFFEEIRSEHGYDYILTAHHLDDRIETFLLNFLRGTGFAGLRSIPSKNDFIRRPLLAVNRQEISEYQAQKNILFREDESNSSDKYKRNFLRHHVLPKLYETAPQLSVTAAQNFDRFEQMHLLYQAQVDQLSDQLLKKTEDGFTIDLASLRSHPAKESLLWEFLNPYGFNREQLRQVLEAKEGTILEVKDFRALVAKGLLIVREEAEEANFTAIYWEEDEEETLIGQEEKIQKRLVETPENFRASSSIIYVDSQKLVYPLELRHWRKGDYFHPFGMNGHRQKLQDFFVNNKINRLDRDQVWLLVNGDGQIIWIVGHRMDEHFKVDENTKSVVKYSHIRC